MFRIRDIHNFSYHEKPLDYRIVCSFVLHYAA